MRAYLRGYQNSAAYLKHGKSLSITGLMTSQILQFRNNRTWTVCGFLILCVTFLLSLASPACMSFLSLNLQTSCPIQPKLVRRIYTRLEQFSSLADDWRCLEKKIPDLLPFQCYDWNYCWWQSFADQSILHRDHLSLSCLYDQGQLVAVMPLSHRYVGAYNTYLFRYVRPFGADPNLTELRLPLSLPEHQASLMQCWADLAHREILGASEFLLIQQKQLAENFIEQQTDLHLLEQRNIPNFVLPLGTDWVSFRAGLKRNIKESLRHCYNSLQREGLSASLRFSQGAAILTDLAQFYALHRARAEATDMVVHPDYFAHPQHRLFLESLLASPFAERMYLFKLEVAGKVVAMRLAFRMNQELYLYYSGYDLAYKQYSVMTTLKAEIIKWAISQQIPALNLSVGEDVSKTRWQPQRRDYLEYRCCKNKAWRISLAKTIANLRKLRKKKI